MDKEQVIICDGTLGEIESSDGPTAVPTNFGHIKTESVPKNGKIFEFRKMLTILGIKSEFNQFVSFNVSEIR